LKTTTGTIAVAIVCKTPEAGRSKTRLSPPLAPEDCAAISSCFIADLSATIGMLGVADDVTAVALYTPAGSEARLRTLLPEGTKLVVQRGEDFGDRLLSGMQDLLADHAGAILVNSDSPTLPPGILRAAVDALKGGDRVVLSRAFDGGYTLIGLARAHARLFEDIPWSTADVYRLTVERAHELGLTVVDVPGWYDVDDAASLALLEDECLADRPFDGRPGASAPATRAFLEQRSRSAA
jgi:uncharacterized protein